MKLLLTLAAVALLVWLLRGDRRKAVQQARPAQKAGKAAPVSGPLPMLRCAACGLHLPAADALIGPDGRVFCSPEHRRGAP